VKKLAAECTTDGLGNAYVDRREPPWWSATAWCWRPRATGPHVGLGFTRAAVLDAEERVPRCSPAWSARRATRERQQDLLGNLAHDG
jgi:hypothetical protein